MKTEEFNEELINDNDEFIDESDIEQGNEDTETNFLENYKQEPNTSKKNICIGCAIGVIIIAVILFSL